MPGVAGTARVSRRVAALPEPMLAMPGQIPADEAGYAFEFKWDGMRALAEVSPSGVRLWSRNGNEVTAWFPELQRMREALQVPSSHRPAAGKGASKRSPTQGPTRGPKRSPVRMPQTALLDGEVVAFDAKGRPSFPLLQGRLGVTRATDAARLAAEQTVHFMAFDVLRLDEESLVERPYSDRRAALEGLGFSGACWGTSPSHTGAGSVMLAMSQRLGLEGIMAKRLDAPYYPGRRTPAWIKVRNRMRQEFVVGGWTEGEGSRRASIGSLLIGYHPRAGRGKLRYVGKVGSGLGGPLLESLLRDLRELAGPSPFEPASELPRRAHLVHPRLVAEVEFTEVTPAGNLRQPSFKGLRLDKDPRKVVWEQVVEAPHGSSSSSASSAAAPLAPPVGRRKGLHRRVSKDGLELEPGPRKRRPRGALQASPRARNRA